MEIIGNKNTFALPILPQIITTTIPQNKNEKILFEITDAFGKSINNAEMIVNTINSKEKEITINKVRYFL